MQRQAASRIPRDAIAVVAIVVVVGCLMYVGTYLKDRSLNQSIAAALGMPHRSVEILPEPLEPKRLTAGEERLLIIAAGDDYILASINRNTYVEDWRSDWKFDFCLRERPDGRLEKLSVGQHFNDYPTLAEIEQFRALAMSEDFMLWDSPEASVIPLIVEK